MHNLKELRKNLDNIKKFDDPNIDFDINDLKKDALNRDLIIKKRNWSKKENFIKIKR